MRKDLSLTKLTTLYILGNLTSKIINFALFFLYTFYISMAELGFFDLIITSVTLITPIITFQVYDAALRWLIHEEEETRIKKIISSSIILLMINLLFFTLIYLFAWYKLNLKYGLLIYILATLQTFYVLIPQFARGIGKNSVYAFNGIVYSFTFLLVAFILLHILDWKIKGLLIANIVAIVVSILFIAYKIRLQDYLKIKFFDKQLTKELIRYSMPLIPNTLSWWLISTSNRYIIIYFWSLSLNGLFAVALKLPSILLLLSGIFSMAWVEKSIKVHATANRDAYYTNIFEKYFSLLFGAIVVLIAVTKPLLQLIVQAAYFEIWKLLPFLYLAVGYQSLSSFYGTGYLTSKNTKAALFTTIYGALATVLTSLLLVPYIGLLGASIAILLGYVVMFIVRVFNTKAYFNITLPVKKILLLNGIIILTAMVTISNNLYFKLGNIVFAMLVFIAVNNNFIKELLLKNKHVKIFNFLEPLYMKIENRVLKLHLKL